MKRFFLPVLAACFLMALASCSPKQNLTYFSDITTQLATDGAITTSPSEIKIQPNDELLINVTSQIPAATAIYNLPLNQAMTSIDITENNTSNMTRMQTYIVDSRGNINFPSLGPVHVEGMTTLDLAEYLEKRISEDVTDPYVRVELVNFKVKVMGEVTKPGTKTVRTEKYNVFDAIADAADMTVYGQRDQVYVLREENGKMEYHRLNLNDSKVMESPYFYLKQNDVVVVQPSKSRVSQATVSESDRYRISVVSAVVSGCSVVASMIIALVINKR